LRAVIAALIAIARVKHHHYRPYQAGLERAIPRQVMNQHQATAHHLIALRLAIIMRQARAIRQAPLITQLILMAHPIPIQVLFHRLMPMPLTAQAPSVMPMQAAM